MFNKVQQFNIGGVDVFVAQFDENVEVKPVVPAARQQVIEQCTDELHRQQRYCVWQLLDYALRKRCGRGVAELSFALDRHGKWRCDGGVHFSLSHSGRVVAVAVSGKPIGIDVEAVDGTRFNDRLAERILTESERTVYAKVPQEHKAQFLAEAWTKKEALFKQDGGKAFVPSAVDTTINNVCCRMAMFGSNQYTIAVAI